MGPDIHLIALRLISNLRPAHFVSSAFHRWLPCHLCMDYHTQHCNHLADQGQSAIRVICHHRWYKAFDGRFPAKVQCLHAVQCAISNPVLQRPVVYQILVHGTFLSLELQSKDVPHLVVFCVFLHHKCVYRLYRGHRIQMQLWRNWLYHKWAFYSEEPRNPLNTNRLSCSPMPQTPPRSLREPQLLGQCCRWHCDRPTEWASAHSIRK